MIIYFCDQLNRVTSGPGNFTTHLIDYCRSNDHKLLVISSERSQDKLISRPHQRVVTIRLPRFLTTNGISTAMVFSILYTLASLAGSKNKIFINGYMYLAFALNLGQARVFVNDSKYMMSRRDKMIMKRVLTNIGQLIVNSTALNREIRDFVPVKSTFTLNKLPSLIFFESKWVEAIDNKISLNLRAQVTPPVRVLFAKHDWRYGNLDRLLESLHSYDFDSPVIIDMAGIPKADRKTLSNICTNANVTLHFYDLMNQRKMQNMYMKADIFINCSHNEAFGLAAIEAALSGCLLISTERNDGLNEQIRNNRMGIICPNLNNICQLINKYSARRKELYSTIQKYTYNARCTYSVSRFHHSLEKLLDMGIT